MLCLWYCHRSVVHCKRAVYVKATIVRAAPAPHTHRNTHRTQHCTGSFCETGVNPANLHHVLWSRLMQLAGLAGGALQAMAVLKAYQADLLKDSDHSGVLVPPSRRPHIIGLAVIVAMERHCIIAGCEELFTE